ncbi:MAG: glycosyltransferase family 4 protein [Bryobacteraceae bacterium]
MRVVQLGPFPPPHGGVQTNLVAIRDYLRGRNVPCDVINLTRFRRPGADGVFYPSGPLQVAALLLRRRYDIIHLHIGGKLPGRLVGLCLFCAMIPWAKTVFTFHSGGYPSTPSGRAAKPCSVRGFVFRRLDRVVTVNEELSEMFRRFGVSEDRLRLILPFTLPAQLPDAEYPEPVRNFLSEHAPLLVTIGQLEPDYDFTLQIEALGRIRSRFPRAGLVIAGADGSIGADLRAHLATLPYRDHVLLSGDLPHPVTLRLIAECDLFLRTSLFDGDSIAVREALHFGSPVIATDTGMRPDGVHLIPLHDVNALCRSIEECLTAPNRPLRVASAPDSANIEAIWRLYNELLA